MPKILTRPDLNVNKCKCEKFKIAAPFMQQMKISIDSGLDEVPI